MSVLINEKLHSRRLKWRWPLSRQVTLSIGTFSGFTHCMVDGGGAATD